jgi:hypothetical protein
MSKLKKKFTYLFLILVLVSVNANVFAQDFSLLPKAGKNRIDCSLLMRSFDTKYQGLKNLPYNSYARFNKALQSFPNGTITIPEDLGERENLMLGCGVVTGKIRFYFWKPYVAYLIKNMSILAGILSMLFITIGGYQYFLAMVSGEDSNAKNTVKNAILGLVISFSSWIIVEIVQSFVSF